MEGSCNWCGRLFSNCSEKYNGAWHYRQVYLEGDCICTDCMEKYNKDVAEFSEKLRKNRGNIV